MLEEIKMPVEILCPVKPGPRLMYNGVNVKTKQMDQLKLDTLSYVPKRDTQTVLIDTDNLVTNSLASNEELTERRKEASSMGRYADLSKSVDPVDNRVTLTLFGEVSKNEAPRVRDTKRGRLESSPSNQMSHREYNMLKKFRQIDHVDEKLAQELTGTDVANFKTMG